MKYAAIPIEKTSSATDFIRKHRINVEKDLGGIKRRVIRSAGPTAIGAGIAIGIPVLWNIMTGIANKTHGLNQFISEGRKKKQFNKQIEVLNRIAENTNTLNTHSDNAGVNTGREYIVTPLAPHHSPVRKK